MYFINPFRGLRPSENNASAVTVPSTDHLSEEAIVNHKKNNPWSYLNIFNPDCQKPDSKKEIEVKAKKQLELMNIWVVLKYMKIISQIIFLYY